MKNLIRRTLSLLLVLVMAASMLPVAYAQETTETPAEPVVLTDEDYASADAVFAQIDAMEQAPATKNATETQLADEAAALVMASDNYVEGSLERNGNSFTWWTTEGVRCVYSPRMREIENEMVAPENPIADGAYNEPAATKGGWPSGNQVYLIAPYYGYDDSFTDQYKNEATAIASAIGDTDGYTLYSGTAATIDTVATAMSNGAVVIFDSHGNTDYENGYDYVSGANYSYLCMKSTTGLTTEDYNDGALYYSDGIWITGASIANHMTKQSPAGLLWMAICLGMATDTFATPMREMGVEVVYGYSQSVTFAGDYLYEEVFWDSMCAGDNVATAIATMKSTWGDWDWSTKIATEYGYTDGYSTIDAARADYAAFPIVVSDEDTHPGQRSGTSNYGADSLQTVKSTYTLFSQYNVTATSNNTAYGTVSVDGSTITATPATGYFAQSATVTSGTATVSQNGNTFSVIAQSDCTVQINFAAKTPVTVSFSGASVASQSGYSGDAMTLPTAEAPEGYKFLGWMTSPLNADTTTKPTYLTGSFTPTGDTTLYALYSYVDENSGTGTGDYVKVTETPADCTGEYLIVYEGSGYIFNGSLSSFDAVDNYKTVTITDSTIAASEGDPYKFTIAAVDNGYSIQGTSGNYIGHGSNANGLTTGTSAMANTITIDASGNANIVSGGGAYLRFNNTSGQNRFRYYKSSTYSSQQPIALYLKDGSAGTTYYTGNPIQCEHTNTQNVAAVAATCTTSGYTAGVQCVDCNTYISGHEVIPATGHSYNGVVTAPTTTEQGYTTYTCATCGDSYVGDYVDALGETFYVSFSVPSGIAAVETMACGKAGITLPTAEAPEGYEFAGWSTTTVDTTTTKPTILTGSYTATADITLYAVYTYTEGGTGSGDYEKVTTAPADWSGEYLIVYEDDGYIFDGSLTTYDAVSNYKPVTITNNTISAADGDPYKFTVASMDGGYSFQGTGSYYFGHTADANKITTSATAMLNTIALDDSGNANIICEGGAYLRFNATSGQTRFRYYKSTSYSSQKPVALYVKSDGGTTYYTTNVTQCEHTNTTDVAAVAATCTESGFTAGVYCNDCETYISGHQVVDALGHSWSDWTVTTAPGCETAGEQASTCAACGETQTQTVAATGHSYNAVVTAPTETEQGYTTYTCTACGNSYVADYTPALGVSYTVSFSVPSGVTAVGSLTGNSSGITLPTAGAPEGYTFAGWSEVTVQETTTAPTILTGTYVPTANTTLYAVYTREETVAGGGSGNYEKVTSAPTDWSGEYLIVYEDAGYIFDGSLTSLDAVSNYRTVTITNNTISAAAGDPYKFTIAVSGSGYSIQSVSGNYIGRSADSNGMNTGTSALVNTIALDSDGNASIIGSGGAYLRFNATSGQTRFRFFKSSTYTNQKPVALYVKSEGATTTTYYTTVFSTEPSVELTHISLVPHKDALGYKAAAYNLPEGAHVEISLWLTENAVVTKATTTLRLINILARNGGEATIYAKATIVDADGNVLAESATEQTTMREAIEYVNDNYTDYSTEQLVAARDLILAHEVAQTWNVANLLAIDEAAIETVNAIYALEASATMENVTLKGTITSIYTEYSETYGNITVIITIAGAEDKPIKCYRMEGDGADALAVGDVITVTGTVTHYVHTSSGNSDFQFAAGCTFTK